MTQREKAQQTFDNTSCRVFHEESYSHLLDNLSFPAVDGLSNQQASSKAFTQVLLSSTPEIYVVFLKVLELVIISGFRWKID